MRFHPGLGQVNPNSLLRGQYSSLAPPTEKKIFRAEQKRGSGYDEQEDGIVGSFGLVTGGIPPGLAVNGEGLTGSVLDSF